MNSIPRQTSDVTAAFVTDALCSTGTIEPDEAVNVVEHEPIGEGVGFNAKPARLTLSYLPSTDPFGGSGHLRSAGPPPTPAPAREAPPAPLLIVFEPSWRG